MNKISLPFSGHSEVTFKMGIHGTQTAPSQVSLNLESANRVCSFIASLSGDGYVCKISDLDKMFEVGEVRCSITVTLNSKVFTPFRGIAEIVEVAHEEKPSTTDEVKVIDFVQPEIPQQDSKVQELPKEIPPVPTAVLPQAKPVSAPTVKFEQKEVIATPTLPKQSILKTIEQPAVLESKTKTKPEKKHVSKEQFFEIKRISVVYK